MKNIIITLVFILIFSSINAQNNNPRWKKTQVIEQEISQFTNNNISKIKLSKREIKQIRQNLEGKHLSINDIKKMKTAIEKDRLRRLFFKNNPKKKLVYLAKPISENTKQDGCVNGGFENGIQNYSFFAAQNWGFPLNQQTNGHPGGFNVNFGNTIGSPFSPISLSSSNVAITNVGFDPILNANPYNIQINTVLNGNHAIRLNPRNENQIENATIMTRNFQSVNESFISLNFAFLMENAHNNIVLDAFIRFEVFDNDINSIVSSRVITAADGVLAITDDNKWRYADWSCLNLDVSQSIGHNVTLRVFVSDCYDHVHDSILYLDDICNNGNVCDQSFFGSINLDPQGINCPTDSFQVCGTFNESSDTVNTTITLNIEDNLSNIISTLTNPTIDNINNTFCFTVNPADFGTNPNGNFEFVANATFTNSNGNTTFVVDEGSNIGPDVSFNNCINCDDINAGFDASISLSGNLIVFDFEAFDYANAVHSWKVFSSTNFIGPYTSLVYSTTTTGSGPIMLTNSLQSGLYYGIKHEVITEDCATVCDDGVLFYQRNKNNKIINNPERASLCCTTFDDLITLISPIDNVLSGIVKNYDTYYNIVANNKIEPNANVTYKANETIVLNAGFHAKYNSLFHAYILPCNNSIKQKIDKNKVNENNENDEFYINNGTDDYFIKVYPNPTKNTITIESSEEVQNWIITSTYGKSYFTGNTTKTINMSNLPNGIYFLKAILKDGKVVMKKIIKN